MSTPPTRTSATKVRWTFAGDFNPVMEITEARRINAARVAVRRRPRTLAGQHLSFPSWPRSTTDELGCASGRTTPSSCSDDDYGVYNFNWGYYLESLRLLCATGTGRPFPPA